MKVTHRDPGELRAGELRATQSPFCSSQLRNSGGPEACSAPEVRFQTDNTQCGPTVSTVDIVTPKAPVLHSKISEWNFL